MSARTHLTVILALVFLLIFGILGSLAYQDKKESARQVFDETLFSSCQSFASPVAEYVRGNLDDRGLDQALEGVLAGEYFNRNIARALVELPRRSPYIWTNPGLSVLLDPSIATRHSAVLPMEPQSGVAPSEGKEEEEFQFETFPGVRQVQIRVVDASAISVGQVRLFVSGQPLDRRLAAVRRLYVILGASGLMLIVGLSLVLARRFARPMETMTLALHRLRGGEIDRPLEERGLREVREMAASYNALRVTLAEKARLDQDLLAAREIQMALLPREKLDIEGWEVWGLCLPAREVGGDFYFWHTRKNRVYAGVGDISGKGMRASLLAALSMGSLKTVFRGEEALEESFPVLNDILFHEFKGKGFLCMNAVDLARGSGRIELVNAGQSYPILIKDHKTLEYWVLENGDLPLGAIREPHYRKDPLQLAEGQGLILFSDGGPELKDTNGQLLGFDEFIRVLQETMDHDLETWSRKAAEALTAWRGEAPQHDDITLLFLRYGRKKWKTTRIL